MGGGVELGKAGGKHGFSRLLLLSQAVPQLRQKSARERLQFQRSNLIRATELQLFEVHKRTHRLARNKRIPTWPVS